MNSEVVTSESPEDNLGIELLPNLCAATFQPQARKFHVYFVVLILVAIFRVAILEVVSRVAVFD